MNPNGKEQLATRMSNYTVKIQPIPRSCDRPYQPMSKAGSGKGSCSSAFCELSDDPSQVWAQALHPTLIAEHLSAVSTVANGRSLMKSAKLFVITLAAIIALSACGSKPEKTGASEAPSATPGQPAASAPAPSPAGEPPSSQPTEQPTASAPAPPCAPPLDVGAPGHPPGRKSLHRRSPERRSPERLAPPEKNALGGS
jgi:hypothetical protein